jgi:hypothetical protein
MCSYGCNDYLYRYLNKDTFKDKDFDELLEEFYSEGDNNETTHNS